MKAALDLLEQSGHGKRRAVILGDMLELGDISERAHREIGEYAAKRTDIFIGVGSLQIVLKRVHCKGL